MGVTTYCLNAKVDLLPWDSKGDYHSLVGFGVSLENLPRHRSTDLIIRILENEKFRAFWQNFFNNNWLVDRSGFMGMKLGIFQGHSGVIFNQDSKQDLIAFIGVDSRVPDIPKGSVDWTKVFGVRQFMAGQSSDIFAYFCLNGDKCH